MSKLDDTLQVLQEASEQYDSVLVAFSAGKDSLAVLDLCKRTFKRVECFYMYFVPGLEFMEKRLEDASKKFGVRIRQFPHFNFHNSIRDGVYCFEGYGKLEADLLKADDVYQAAIAEAGIPLIATGMKKTDFLFRRLNLGRNERAVKVIHPISSWGRFDVLAYLTARNIPIPEGTDALTNSVDLGYKNLLWLYDNHPEDFKRLLVYFPFAEAVIQRRKFYGSQVQNEEKIQNLKPKGWLK